MSATIYRIRNKKTGKNYVGSTTTLQRRWAYHLHMLRNNKHCSKRLQGSFNKHGEAAFIFSILEICPVAKRFKRETYWIRFYEAFTKGYNAIEDPTHPALSVEGLKKRGENISKALSRPGVLELRNAKIVQALRRPENVEKSRQRMLALWQKPKIRAMFLRHIRHTAKTRLWIVTDETRKRMSLAAKKRARTPEGRAHLLYAANQPKK